MFRGRNFIKRFYPKRDERGSRVSGKKTAYFNFWPRTLIFQVCRKNAQQECVKALTRFHYRECDRFRSELQKEKRPRVPKKNATGTVVNKSFAKKKQTHSAPSENIVTLSNVNKLAESIQTKISKFGELLSTLQNMENKHVEQYTCLLSDSDTGKGTKRKQSEK